MPEEKSILPILKYWKSFLPVFLFSVSLGAQSNSLPQNLSFQNIVIPGGVKANMVSRITQDSFGFLWFPSSDGLHRFDGEHFRSYFFDNDQNNSEGQNQIEKLIIDSDGAYWVASQGNGLYQFDVTTGAFEHYKFRGGSNLILENSIVDMVEGPNGNLWLATVKGILAFNRADKSFTHFDKVEMDGRMTSLSRVETVTLDDQGKLWFGAGDIYAADISQVGGLFQYVQEKNSLQQSAIDFEGGPNPGTLHISSMYEDKKGKIWIGTAAGSLLELDPRTQKIQSHAFRNPPVAEDDESLFISSITEDNCGRLWLAVFEEGLYCYDPISGESKLFQADPQLPSSLYSNRIIRLFTAADGTIWIAGGTVSPYLQSPSAFLQKIEVCDERR
ncbi:MAG: hypothetical protein HRU41_38845, partial [Saprospiraceae bacterium]|nr:hypothetical protein [Saprospiraceae bacterium]